jgi:hypothetical protein
MTPLGVYLAAWDPFALVQFGNKMIYQPAHLMADHQHLYVKTGFVNYKLRDGSL